MSKAYRVQAAGPAPKVEPPKTFCINCHYMQHPYKDAQWDHWKCRMPHMIRINPVNGETKYDDVFCQIKNKSANCPDFVSLAEMSEVEEDDEVVDPFIAAIKKKPWWKFW